MLLTSTSAVFDPDKTSPPARASVTATLNKFWITKKIHKRHYLWLFEWGWHTAKSILLAFQTAAHTKINHKILPKIKIWQFGLNKISIKKKLFWSWSWRESYKTNWAFPWTLCRVATSLGNKRNFQVFCDCDNINLSHEFIK